MPYINYNDDLDYVKYLDIAVAEKFIAAARGGNLNVASVRTLLLSMIQKFDFSAPYSETSRFPAKRRFLDMSDGTVADVISAIELGLMFRDAGRTESGTKISTLNTDNSVLSAKKSIDSLRRLVDDVKLHVTRSKFETSHSLNWLDPQPVPTSGGAVTADLANSIAALQRQMQIISRIQDTMAYPDSPHHREDEHNE